VLLRNGKVKRMLRNCGKFATHDGINWVNRTPLNILKLNVFFYSHGSLHIGIRHALAKIMMKVAVPLFGSRISPRFDFCEEILIVTIEQGRIVNRKTVSISSLTPHQRIAELSNRNVKAMICGGINHVVCSHLKSHGISVISDVMGEADEALNRYLAGQLRPWAFCEGQRKGAWKRWNGHNGRFTPFENIKSGSIEREEENE